MNYDPHNFDGFDPDDMWAAHMNGASHAPMNGTSADAIKARVRLEFPSDPSPAKVLDYVCKGLIILSTYGSLVGASGIGKTALALDLCFHVALGLEYHGRRVKKRPVLFVGYEGDTSLKNRIDAAVQKYGDPVKYFARLLLPPTLNKTEAGVEGVKIIVEAARRLSEAAGQACAALIVLDTEARARAGDDENSAADAAIFAEQRAGEIIRQTSAAVMTVHHTGKDSTKGGRGSSAGPAAHDFRFIINENREFFVDKVRDGPDQFVLFSYDLEVVELRRDSEGDPVTACVIKPKGEVPRKSKIKLTAQSKRALEILRGLYIDGKAHDVRLTDIGLEGVAEHKRPRVVPLSEWREKCYHVQLVSDGKPESERKAFGRAAVQLTDAGYIARYADFVWLLDPKRTPGQSGTHWDNDVSRPAGTGGSERDGQGQHPRGVSVRPARPAPKNQPSFGEPFISQSEEASLNECNQLADSFPGDFS